MTLFLTKINENSIFSSFLILSLTASLFYTGNNTWLFTASFILIVFSLAFILKQRFYKSLNISVNGILISAVLLLTWFAISIFPAQIKYLSLYNFFWIGSLVIVFLLFTFNENKDQIWKTVWPAILLLVFIWAIYGLVQYYYLHVPTNASFLNRNSLAALINLALIPASAYFLLSEKERPWKFINNKILALTLIILFLTAFIITSRGGSLSLILGFMVLFSLLFKHVEKSQIYSLFIIIFISFLLATLSQYFIQDSPSGFTERMVTLQNTSKAGGARFIIWNSLIPLFNEMPWYGLGLGSLWVFWPPYRSTNDTSAGFFSHNDYMQITLEAGYPGILLLVLLFIFILIHFIRTIKNDNLLLLQRAELIGLFAALVTFAAHSFFTYNFYILPLLLIAGIYLGRFNQLVNINTRSVKTIPAFKIYFKPIMFIFSMTGLIFILCSYFLSISLSSYYNMQAKELMLQKKYQDSNAYFLKAQTLAPLMDNPFFSHADLLRRGANKLYSVNKNRKANSLLKLAHDNLDKAEKLNPLRPQTHHIRGLIFEREQPEKAKIEFKKALKLDPRFLFSRIRLATLLHQKNQLKKAMEVLYDGVNYNYPVNKVMIEYMTLFAKLSREAGVESFALHLEANIKKYIGVNRQN
ncbi:MAG: O-antigen ligase family protein [Gammaproteobacteria bacterium]|nr:O-antigen ligase family protein [Gammaproteobacteria bacterium]